MKKAIVVIVGVALFATASYAGIFTVQYSNSCAPATGGAGGCANAGANCTGYNGNILYYPWGTTQTVTGHCTDCGSAYSELVNGCCCS